VAEVVAGFVVALALITLFALTKRGREHRHRGSATVACRISVAGVERELADGRREAIRFDDLVQIEVVCTPVPTADDARTFALLAAVLGEEPDGCLVPLGVGYDEHLLDRLVRLPGFDIRAWADALERRAPSRVVVWTAPPVDGA
jgi:hypothetical protein